MKTEDEVDKSKLRAVFHCRTMEKTWANQRRKRRERLRQSTPHESQSSNENKGCQQDGGVPEKVVEIDPTGTKDDDSSSLFSGVLKDADVLCNENSSCDKAFQQDQTDPRPLVSFVVRVGTGAEISSDFPSDSVVMETSWVDGQNKNDLYQLFQFFQNRFLTGL